MDARPEIIFFAQNKIGGVQTFYSNLVGFEGSEFEKKWVLVDRYDFGEARPITPFKEPHEIFHINSNESTYEISERLSKIISNRPGAVVTNFRTELICLHLYRRKNKTIYFVCHDEVYIDTAIEFEFLIDVFIAHNPYFYKQLKELFPFREADIYYIPYGITPHHFEHQINFKAPLRLLFLARLHEKKGIHELLRIHNKLVELNVPVQWTVIGNGPEKENFRNSIQNNPVFSFHSDLTNEAIVPYLKQNDIFVLPSFLDGVPLAMLETMSAGLVPVIYRFNDGIEAIFGEEAFIVKTGDVDEFAVVIERLHYDRTLLENYSLKSAKKIRADFNLIDRNSDYYNLFNDYKRLKKVIRRKIPNYGGMLNHPIVPSFIRSLLRWLRNRVSLMKSLNMNSK